MTKNSADMPDQIMAWLWGGDIDDFGQWVTRRDYPISGSVEYVRKDKFDALQDEIAQLRDQRETMRDLVQAYRYALSGATAP